jgi:hypothetical protein
MRGIGRTVEFMILGTVLSFKRHQWRTGERKKECCSCFDKFLFQNTNWVEKKKKTQIYVFLKFNNPKYYWSKKIYIKTNFFGTLVTIISSEVY